MTELEIARGQINEIDREMAKLFSRRMDAVKQVAAYKQKTGMPVFDPAREEEVVKKNARLLENSQYESYYINFLRSNMELSRTFQHRLLEGMKVAYSGTVGAFANIAAQRIFPDGTAVPYPDFTSAYNSVVNGECDCVVLPIENSYNGDVGQVMDLAFFGSLYINGIYDIGVVQNLLANKGATLESVKEVISHPQALGQCADFIHKHGYKTVTAVNTAIAAREVSDSGRIDIAAIGSEEAADEFGLVKLEGHINGSSMNTTRFAVFSRVPKSASPKDNHFILVFTVHNEAGALGRAISVIGKHGFNLRALKSRPTKDLIWSYYFYVEGEGNIHSDRGESMLDALTSHCSDVKIVGNFEKEIQL